MQFTFSLQNIEEAASRLWAFGSPYNVWAFYGEMGSGKTTLIHKLCEVLQVSSPVGSPTYSIINEYSSSIAGTIFHMDWYRLKSADEALQAGVEDVLFCGNLCLVEWPERAAGLLPEQFLQVHISLISEDTRSITVHTAQSQHSAEPLNLPKSS